MSFLVTNHESRITRAIPDALLVAALCMVLFPQGAAAQAPLPLEVDADQVIYDDTAQTVDATGSVSLTYRGIRVKADFAHVDLRQERLQARGHVVILDGSGREIRAETLAYDVREQAAELSAAETIVDGVYVYSESMRARPGLIVAGKSTLTTCDPEHPGFRVTAASIEVIPGERAIMQGATLWLGTRGILGLPTLTVSLRSRKETAGSFPSAGYTNIDGLFLSYRYAFFVGAPLAYLSTSLGTLALRGEAGVLLPERSLGALPLSLTASASAGWHRESGLNVETTRLQYVVGLQTPDIHLGPQTDWRSSWNWTDASYATTLYDPNGDRQSVLRLHSAVTHRLVADATLTLGYDVLRGYGATPLAVDAIEPEDLIDEVRLEYRKSGAKDDAIATAFKAGAFYDYTPEPTFGLINTTSVYAAYGERVAGQFHWEAGAEYNLDSRAVTIITDTGVALGTDTSFTVQARYNTTTTLFEDLDYILTAEIYECFELSVKYRQVRQQLEIGIGLSTLP